MQTWAQRACYVNGGRPVELKGGGGDLTCLPRLLRGVRRSNGHLSIRPSNTCQTNSWLFTSSCLQVCRQAGQVVPGVTSIFRRSIYRSKMSGEAGTGDHINSTSYLNRIEWNWFYRLDVTHFAQFARERRQARLDGAKCKFELMP